MTSTPTWLVEKICAYYRETTETSYLRSWSREALAFHMGMHDDRHRTHEASLDNTNRFLADRAGIQPGMRVLDAGCGIGGSAIWLARERGAIVDGISLEPGGVRLASRFAAERGVAATTTFQVMDFMATTFPPGTFDVVWNLESLCYAHDVAAYLAHVRTLLKDGGRFACIDVFRGDAGPAEHHRALSQGCALANLGSRPECAEAVRRAGFDLVEDEDLTPRIVESAHILRDKAQLGLLLLELEQTVHGRQRPIYRGHALGALGAANGFFSGAVTYGYVGGVHRG